MDPTTSAPRRNVAMRRIGAILGGLVAVTVTSTAADALMRATGVFPGPAVGMSNALFLLAAAYRTLFGVLAGYVTARLAPDKPLNHAVVLGVIGSALSLAGALATWNKGPEFGPHWYPLSLVVTSLPSSWLGGKIVAR